jgi:hypothetical protein
MASGFTLFSDLLSKLARMSTHRSAPDEVGTPGSTRRRSAPTDGPDGVAPDLNVKAGGD